jgi:hypothetical protein
LLAESLRQENTSELFLRTFFWVVAYSVVGYKITLMNKQVYLGKESNEKIFYRWLSIFETFQEGLGFMKDG